MLQKSRTANCVAVAFHKQECIFIGKYFFKMLLQTPVADTVRQICMIFFYCKAISKIQTLLHLAKY